MPTQRFLDEPLIYVNLYQHAKNQANSSISSRDMIKKSCNLIAPKIFWSISQELKFSQRWYLFRNAANNINFRNRKKSVKADDPIRHFPIFLR